MSKRSRLKWKRVNTARGMTLVEVLVATAIVMIAVLSVSAVYLHSARSVTRSMERAEAARLVQAIRAYALDELVDAAGQLAVVTPRTITSSEWTLAPTLVTVPESQEMIPANILHSPYSLVWELEVTTDAAGPGYVDPGSGVRRHIATVKVFLDTERDRAPGAGDRELFTDRFFIFDLEP